jgi:hypothetical protein
MSRIGVSSSSWVYSGEVFRCEAIVNVMAMVFGSEVGCFQSVYVVYGLVYECFVLVDLLYVYWSIAGGFGRRKGIGYVRGRAFVGCGVTRGSFK